MTEGETKPSGRWDPVGVHLQFVGLIARRARFRIARTLERAKSPRRIVATSLAVLFFSVYLLNGLFILSARAPADPERLRLWLSGGMVIYAIYHCTRCVWTRSIADLELTPAEALWLAGAPVKRSTLAVYHLGNIILAAAMKTGLLAVVLLNDVAHLELLVAGVFTSLLLLEVTRLIIQRFTSGLSQSRRRQFCVGFTMIAAALLLQWIARTIALTPMGSPTWMYVLNSFTGLGQTAACDMIQWMSLPWIVPAQIALTESYSMLTMAQLLGTASLIPLAIIFLVRVDRWSSQQQLLREKNRFAKGVVGRPEIDVNEISREQETHPIRRWLDKRLPSWTGDTMAVISRQAVSVARYKGTIAFSFIIPVLLCLSPLFTGQVRQQWFFVVGGIAMCTMLLAPPALRLDFRRDLQRMMLLRSMPIRPLSMVMGQLTLPILITWMFQWITILVAAIVTAPGIGQVIMWTGMLNALAVFTFAGENALFLAFPHHQHSEGVAMMVRAKLTFMGKATVIGCAIGLLGVWAIACGNLPQAIAVPTLVSGALLGTWAAAVAAVAVCTWCWRRFDLSLDIPPA